MIDEVFYLILKAVKRCKKVEGRAKFQKIIYLLQEEGRHLELDYFFHYYGPYSQDLADILDDLTRRELLREDPVSVSLGVRFDYSITDKGKKFAKSIVAESESPSGLKDSASSFGARFQKLYGYNLRVLELAASLVYWRRRNYSRTKAIKVVGQLKKVSENSTYFRRAERLAKEVLEN